MRIILLTNPKNQYGVLNHFEKGIKEALIRKGVEVRELAVDEHLIKQLAETKADYTLSVNLFVGQHNLGTPHIVYLVDWGTYIPDSFKSFNTIMCHVDAQSSVYMSKDDICQNIFLPHAIEREAVIEDAGQVRDIEVLFAGTYQKNDLLKKLSVLLSANFVKAIKDVVEETLASHQHSHVYFLEKLLKDKPSFKEELRANNLTFFDLCHDVENIMRAQDRINLIKSIERDVHIYGNNMSDWQRALADKKNCIFHDAVNFTQVGALFQRSKIVLNSNPMFKTGLHERMLLALANGASVITNQNLLLPHCFPENLSVATFVAPNYSDVNEKIEKILADESSRKNAVKDAQALITRYHTWDQRLAHLFNKL